MVFRELSLRDVVVPPRAAAALAAFVRERLADASGGLRRVDAAELLPADGAVALARQFAVAVVGAAAPFAPTSYARARLLRQMYASGLLTDDEVRRTARLLDEPQPPGTIVDVATVE